MLNLNYSLFLWCPVGPWIKWSVSFADFDLSQLTMILERCQEISSSTCMRKSGGGRMLLPKAIIVVEIDNNYWRKTDPRNEVSSFGHKLRIRFRMLFSLSLKCCSVMPFPHAFADDHTQFLVFPYSGLLQRASAAIRFIHLDSILTCRSCLIWKQFWWYSEWRLCPMWI